MGGGSGALRIAAVLPQLVALPTKTRPKRLVLLGSDGRQYTYLLKGRDDLRADERLMQVCGEVWGSGEVWGVDRRTRCCCKAAHVGRMFRFGLQSSQLLAVAQPLRNQLLTTFSHRIRLRSPAAAWHQVLRFFNVLLQCDPSCARLGLSVRHYSVTPLGERTGLIQWVGGTASLFSLFRQWQQDRQVRHAAMLAARQTADAATAAAATATAKSAGPAPARQGAAPGAAAVAAGAAAAGGLPGLPPMAAAARPTDLFYARLVPALAEAGVGGGLMAPRRDWPLPALRRVLLSLASDSPRSLVSSELRCGSASAQALWQRQRRFNASLAAASVAGYLLGLGDRHMDNVLMDRDTAELVHIDYSVCFGKGAKLRVPEIVPFRWEALVSVWDEGRGCLPLFMQVGTKVLMLLVEFMWWHRPVACLIAHLATPVRRLLPAALAQTVQLGALLVVVSSLMPCPPTKPSSFSPPPGFHTYVPTRTPHPTLPRNTPPRLTQTLVTALGATGVDGLFRVSCEAALSALRTRKDSAAALLDAVLADPGVEWAAEREDAAARQDLELAAALQLFASRSGAGRQSVCVCVWIAF